MPVRGVSVGDALDSASVPLRAIGCDTCRLDAELLLAEVLQTTRADLLTRPERELEGSQARRFQELMHRRVAGREPVAYLLGRRAFRNIELAVDPRVLIPRPETEHLVEAALTLPAGARVVDVGTGSGAVALALKHERPDLSVVATDSDEGALAVVRSNAARLGLEVELLLADLLEGVDGPLDAVVSNPPYVADGDWAALAPETTRHEPRRALAGGADGLDVFRQLVPVAAARAPFVALEVGAGQAAAVAALLHAAGMTSVEARCDLAGIERVVIGRR